MAGAATTPWQGISQALLFTRPDNPGRGRDPENWNGAHPASSPVKRPDQAAVASQTLGISCYPGGARI